MSIGGVHADLTFDLHHRDIADDTDLARLTLNGPAGDGLTALWLSEYSDRPLVPFAVAPHVLIPAGYYRWYQDKIQFLTSASRPVSGLAYFRAGNYYNGTQTEEKGSVDWRPNGHWNFTATLDLYQIKLPAGLFDVRNLSGSIAWFWSPYFFGSILGQFDTQSRLLGLDYRIQWIIAPRRSLFLVRSRGYFNDPHAGWRAQSAQETAKLGWTYQF